MRTTHTYARRDVAEAVQKEALRRGCTPQDVVNDTLAQVLIDGAIGVRDRQIASLQHAIDVLAGRARGLASPMTSGAAEVPTAPSPPGVRVTTLVSPGMPSKNVWE